MSNGVTVSIIMPTYNRASIIEKAIKSVVDQTFSDYELIVIDDGSTDGTCDTVKRFSDSRIRCISYSENRGGSYARNRGIEEACGNYIAFLDSDNEWDNDYLEKRLALLHDESRPVISFGRMRMIRDGKEDSVFPPESADALSERNSIIRIMLCRNIMDTNTVILSRECVGIEAGFDLEFTRLQDWDIFLGIVADERNAVLFEDRISVSHYALADSITNKKELYMPNRLQLVKKHKKLIDEFGMKEEIGNRLEAEIQTDGDYKRIYDVAKRMNDDLITEYVLNAIIAGAEREKNTSDLLKKMLALHDDPAKLVAFFENNSYNTVAVYGNGFLGKRVIKFLTESGIDLKYVIDMQNYDHIENGIHYINSSKRLGDVDVVLIAMFNDTEEVARVIKSEREMPVYALKDLI